MKTQENKILSGKCHVLLILPQKVQYLILGIVFFSFQKSIYGRLSMGRLKVQFFQKGLLLAQFYSGVDQMKEWFK